MAKQNEAGKKAEKVVCEFFAERKYWTFPIPKSINGQPFDIIARKDSKNYKDIWFVDAKHLESNKASFPFDRIEPNQESSMSYAHIINGVEDNMGFVIQWERTGNLYYFDYQDFLKMKEKGEKSVKIEDLALLGELCKY